ncbi:hypothetical protein [Paenibacillus paeoniae]|uniref:Uncharacterized protein n=1 Tax=Paenibacillus paeoniae TaxID=2292705 RepID=A0A371PGL7_9BACL|nr:hypothetical protein [Paenibacillus paeoniae]REK75089.1 hypothetical protein DX130_15775 [Paenibacillus paeoniae]
MTKDYVWGIFVANSSSHFPNFFPIGMYTTRELAMKQIKALPREHHYQLLQMPLNNSFAYYHKKSGELVGMDAIHHEHFHFGDGS